jgi:hypothetical protein
MNKNGDGVVKTAIDYAFKLLLSGLIGLLCYIGKDMSEETRANTKATIELRGDLRVISARYEALDQRLKVVEEHQERQIKSALHL